MYSFSGNSAASAPISTFMCLLTIYIVPGSVYIFPPAEFRPIVGIYKSCRHMNVEIGTETPIFLFWYYLFQNFGLLSLQCDIPAGDGKIGNPFYSVIVCPGTAVLRNPLLLHGEPILETLTWRCVPDRCVPDRCDQTVVLGRCVPRCNNDGLIWWSVQLARS